MATAIGRILRTQSALAGFREWTRQLPFLALIGLTVLLAFYNLEGYPALGGLDEGFRLQAPRSLALYGQWAALTADGFVPFWRDSTGPVVLFPVALAFKLWGHTLWNARMVVAPFLIMAISTLYLCVRHLYNARVALLAGVLFLLAGPPWLNSVTFGRQVYGEVPAMAFLFIAAYLWFAALESRRPVPLLLSSVFFGLMVLAKDLILIGVIPSLLLIAAADRLGGQRRLHLQHVALPVVFMLTALAMWSLLQGFLGGADTSPSGFLESARVRIFPLKPHLWYQNIKFLATEGFLLWAIPAVIYGIIRAYRAADPVARYQQLFFPLFASVWVVWYAFVSIGWTRYMYPAWAAVSVPLAVFLHDLALRFGQQPDLSVDAGSGRTAVRIPKRLDYLPVVVLVVIYIGWPMQNTIRRLLSNDNAVEYAFAAYINSNIPASDLIASCEWEIDFLTGRPMLHPPFSAIEEHIRHHQLGYPPQGNNFDVLSNQPDYIINGPFNKSTNFIPDDIIADQELVVSIGDYDLYHVVSDGNETNARSAP